MTIPLYKKKIMLKLLTRSLYTFGQNRGVYIKDIEYENLRRSEQLFIQEKADELYEDILEHVLHSVLDRHNKKSKA